MRKTYLISAIVMLLLVVVGQSVWAYSDTKGDPNEAKITELQKQGIVSSSKDDKFNPKDKLTYAAGITLIVKGLGINIDDKQFIKQPLASDYFTRVKDNAWYADAFIIAHLNGLDIPKDIDPSAPLTREQYAHHLFRAMMTKGDFAFIELFMLIHDEADVTPVYMESIQKLLISKIVQLDSKQNFNPQAIMTRGEGAGWLHDAMRFVKENILKPEPGKDVQPFPLYDPAITIEAVNEEVNKVTVTAQAPSPGYGMRISSITFEGDQATLNIEPIYPQKDMMYPQVLTEVKIVTFIAKSYKPVLNEAGSSMNDTASSDGSAAVNHE
ncbi:S-layer homology domain-containing protein [Paenibacillus oenotherae]|uniref:S-layer homology domain-containing protein n=1 Tax=Paenibacillus oenotherae TaxID=1435645 RepID=A0ABS7D176_9BACL|nr:S-layer homology domain-containing protein [Paenibacillus oenotherae]MBW7473608.1 S-layer homology domain-containing protein [Paenibacillus oenotherae]